MSGIKYISVSNASKLLGLTEQRIRQFCREGLIDSSKEGKSWLLKEDAVASYGKKAGHILAPNQKSASPKSKKRTALSFFSGAMGMDLGIEKEGFEVRSACEFDKFCRQTISINRPNLALLGDVNEQDKVSVLDAAGLSEKDDIDLIVGGPPCQAFSTAGKRKGINDPRGNVFLKFLDLAISLDPKVLVIENVRGLLSCAMNHRPTHLRGKGFPDLRLDEQKGGALNFILQRLKNAGYRYSFNLYNAANYGTPQIRERVVIICSKYYDKLPYIQPTHSNEKQFKLKKWKTFQQATKNLKEHDHINFPERRLKYYRLLKSGENWRNLPLEVQKEAMGKSFYSGGGKTGFYRRIALNKPSPTLVTHPAMPATDLAHPCKDRPLSIQEYKRIQEFPDNWELAGSLIEQYKQVGNAVPASLGIAIAKMVNNLFDSVEINNPEDYPYSRYKRTCTYEWQEDFLKRAEGCMHVQGELNLD